MNHRLYHLSGPLRQGGTQFLLFLILGVLWELGVRFVRIPEYVLPAPSRILRVLGSDIGSLASDAGWTLLEALLGFLLSMTAAMIISIVFSINQTIERHLIPYIASIQAIPIIVIAPILAIWFQSTSILPKVLMATIIALAPATAIINRGFHSASSDALDLMQSMAATRTQVLFKLRLPSAVSYIFVAARVAATLASVGATVAEFSSATHGIGFRIIISSYRTDTPTLFCSVLIAIGISLLMYVLVVLAERLLLWFRPFPAPL